MWTLRDQRRGSSYAPVASDPGERLLTGSTRSTVHLLIIQRQQRVRRAGGTGPVWWTARGQECA